MRLGGAAAAAILHPAALNAVNGSALDALAAVGLLSQNNAQGLASALLPFDRLGA